MARIIRSLIVVGVLASVGIVPLGATSSSIGFALDSSGAIVIEAQINGRGPYRLFVDTGSSRAALSQRTAVEVGAPVVAKSSVVSIGQDTMRLVVRLDRVDAGSATRPNVLASVIPDDDLRAVAPGVDGVLGQDFLAAFNYTINFGKRTISWDVAPATLRSADTQFKLRTEEGRFLVEIPGDKDGQRPLRLVPDSGASVMVLYERDGRLPVSLTRTRRPLEVSGLSGGRRAMLSSLIQLRIGPVLLRDTPVVVLSECNDVPGADGLMPLHLFDRVSFLASEGLLVVGKN